MRKIPYKKVDAFTGEGSLGNPAAFLVLPEALTPAEYLAIGREHAGFVSEVVFCSPSAQYPCKLTYYSSECEVEFCGHGTIATMYELVRTDPALRARREIQVETARKGVITVYNSLDDEDAVYITAPAPLHLAVPAAPAEIAATLGLAPEKCAAPEGILGNCAASLPIDFIDAGLRTLIVPVADLETEVRLYPDEAGLKDFCAEKGIDIVLTFSRDTAAAGFAAHTRVFAPKFGYLEDPATGSGNSAFGNYLLKNGLWSGEPIAVEQGGDNIAYNTVRLKTNNGAVLFGGRATARIEGSYLLP